MRTLVRSLLPIAAAAPVALGAQAATSTTARAVARAMGTWSGPTPACRLDRCGPSEIRVCLLRFRAPDPASGPAPRGQDAVPGTAWPLGLLGAARADSGRRPLPAPRPRR